MPDTGDTEIKRQSCAFQEHKFQLRSPREIWGANDAQSTLPEASLQEARGAQHDGGTAEYEKHHSKECSVCVLSSKGREG